MKDKMLRIGLFITAAAAVIMIALIYVQALSPAYRFYSFVKSPPLVEHFAVGELAKGKVAELAIHLRDKEFESLSLIPKDTILCVGALMAIYPDGRDATPER